MKILLGVFIALCLIAFSAQAQDRQITGDAWYGCISKDYYGKLVDYVVQSDREAFKKGVMMGILTGQCILFKVGEPVYLADTAIFSGLVKLRRKGEIAEYWTNLEAVK
jgi:hypothetical protein